MSRWVLLSLWAVTVVGCAGGSATNESAAPVPSAPSIAPAGGTSSMAQSPDVYQVEFDTTKGKFVVEVHRDWAPNGADRFYQLVQEKFFDQVKFFRAVEGFMVQFGIHGNPEVSAKWRENMMPDDPVVKSNTRGMITYAKPGFPNSRTTQVFINYGNNANLDGMGFAPFGEVISGMDVVDSLHKGYGEEPSQYQPQIQQQGNAFLDQAFPDLDSIITAKLIGPKTEDAAPAEATEKPVVDPVPTKAE